MRKELSLLLLFCCNMYANAQVVAVGDHDQGDYSYHYTQCAHCKEYIIAYIPNSVSVAKQFATEKSDYLDSVVTILRNDKKEIRLATMGQLNFDSSAAIFTVQGITKAKAPGFEYRVMQDGAITIMAWHAFTQYTAPQHYQTGPHGEDDPEMASIGKLSTGFGHYLTVDVRRKGTDTIVSSATVLWMKTQPKILGVFTNGNLNDFLTVFKNQWQRDIFIQLSPQERKAQDSMLVLKNSFPAQDNNIIFYLDDKVRSKEFIEYSVTGPGSTTGWKPNDFDYNFIWLKNLSSGNYVLHTRFSVQRQNVTDYPFQINAAWYQSAAFKIIACSLIIAFIAFVFALFRLRDKQRKLLAAQLKNAKTEVKLNAIRSQLNPHFIFNALSSIQGLINKKDIPAANKYLGDFGDLMRDSLIAKDTEFISAEQEIKLLDTYLQLEKLRFNFAYTISADSALPLFEISIPVLLLQPIVENAVKHGVAALQNKGNINVVFTRMGDDMVVDIVDNGGGFDINQKSKGFGINLTKERIALLNEMNGDKVIGMRTESSETGTTVHISFKNWL